ncbi:hypothetical protein N0V90_013267 [Kalmusia sp. IMI 367209]|nr:hypothetical protein N0V90_013267 [Kalmusia sp. IMI 367209]
MSPVLTTELSQNVKEFDDPSRQDREEIEDNDDDSSVSSESDPEDDEQGHAVAGKPLHDVFKEIILKIKEADKSIDLEDLVREQLSQNADKLTKATDQGKTILHMVADIASENRKRVSNLKPLISELIRQHEELAVAQDNELRTPLHYAIKLHVARVVGFIADALGDRFDEILLIPNNTKDNGLHTALKDPKRKNNLTIDLIKRVQSPKTFGAKNIDKLTPMHIAVEYDRCNAKQIEIIDEMIRCWDINHAGAGLNVNVLSENEDSDERSVFRHHQWTRENASKKDSAKETSAVKSGVKVIESISKIQVEKASKDLKGPVEPISHPPVLAVPSQSIKPSAPRSGPKSNPKTPVVSSKSEHIPGVVRKATFAEMDAQKHEGPKADATTSKLDGQAGYLDKKKSRAEPVNDKDRTMAPPETKPTKMTQEEAADIIRDKLKMHYMCTRDDHTQILSFLYGPNEVKQISLSFVGGPTVIHEARLEKMRYVKFDQTLHYLELPNVEVRMSKPRNASPDEECEGRKEYEAIFNWLKSKAVKQIIHLFVDDYHPCSHSDESIEKALEDLKVIKTWDWRKLDIDSMTLLKAAPDVQEIVLYWSGRNAVLRGWSEPDGLHRLRNLRKVTVHGTPGLETSKKALAHLDEFKKRMEQLRGKATDESNNSENLQLTRAADKDNPSPPQIKVECGLRNFPPIIIGVNDSMRLAQNQPPEEQKWIACVKRFNKYAKDLLSKQGGRKPITIALIDDGVDFADERIQSMVEDGRSYYQRQSKLIAPFWTSSGGHGTAMAGLIRTMCPMAKLFVLRLNEYTSINGKRQISADSAAKAVRDAIAKGVDIVSMSWTIDSDGNDDGIAKLKAALLEAEKRNILLFCAAQDQGVKLDTSFPGQSSACFKIGAATSWGTAHKSSGTSTNHVDYIFPGQNIAQDQSGSQRSDKAPLLTGSSVATAFAAGLAALILRCVQCAAQCYEEVKNKEEAQKMDIDFEALKDRTRMQQAFESIGEVRVDNTKYLMVWNVFGKAGTQAKDDDPFEKREWILKIAKSLVHQKELR